MISEYKDYWTKYFRFSGRSTRSDFWWVVLVNILIGIGVLALTGGSLFSALGSVFSSGDQAQNSASMAGFGFVFLILYQLVTFIPNISLQCRRIIDTGLSGGWCTLVALAYLLPGIALVTSFSDAANALDGNATANSSWMMLLWFIVQIALLVINLTPTDAFGRHRS